MLFFDSGWSRSVAASLTAAAVTVLIPVLAPAATLRVVEYNVNADTADTNGFKNATATEVETVLSAIGSHQLAGNAQPIDVLALTELQGVSGNGISPTLSTITNDLNAIYGAGTYAYNTTADTTDGSTGTGNGPSGLIYNQNTISGVTGTVIASAVSGTDPRAPVRYAITPMNGTASSQFYLYVDHYKADQSTSDAATRANESVLVRQNADALAANVPNANIIETGDFNLAGGSNSTSSSGSGEQEYKNLTAVAGSTLSSGTGATSTAGAGQMVDPLPTSFLANSAAYTDLYTESATALTARFDLQLVSKSISTGSNGLQLIPDTETAFGNSYYNGTTLTTSTVYGQSVSNGSNQALSDLPNAATVLSDLTLITDHLPIVADYSYTTVPEPTTLTLLGAAGLLLVRRRWSAAN